MDFTLIILLVVNGVFGAPMLESGSVDTTVPTEWCGGKPADIFFLLDSSSSIWIYDYKKQLKFISDIVDIFEISPEQTRVAVSAFSHFYKPFIHFDSYDNKDDLKRAITKVPYLRGQTYTGKALQKMGESGFAKARPGVAHIAIVLTDGVSAHKEKTKKEAEKLKKKGVYLFSVGIGNKFDKGELRAIASEPSDDFVYDVASFDMLKTIRETLAFKACNVEPVTEAPMPMDQPACGLRERADMMFCFDSAATGSQRSKIVYKFITELTDEFNMDDSSIRVGVTSRNCHEHDIHLDDYIQKDALLDAINSIEYRGLAPVIQNMRKHAFSESHGGRTEAKKIAVLFVDEETDNLEFVIKEAEETKKHGIEVFVVSVGQVDISALRKIASEPIGSHVIKVSSYKDIPMLKDDFINSVCQDL